MNSRRTFLSTTSESGGRVRACAPSAESGQGATRGPDIPYGTSSGDVTRDRAIIWSRTDRPARMLVDWSTTESFQNVRRVRGPQTTDAAGYTARVDLTGLPPGQRIFYRVQFEDLTDSRNLSTPAHGTFLSAPREARDVTFAWSADTVGQGWGINTAWGGLRMYETMRLARPDFFIHTGDTIYADSTVPPEIRLPDGTMWRNVVTDEKSKVAETLDEFRGNYTYNLLDDNVRRFNREIPQLWLWDDHEVKNNWYPGMSLDADDRYTQKDARVLAANARQAFLEYSPMRLSPGAVPPIYRSCSYGPLLEVFAIDLRTYRGPNTTNRQNAAGAETVHAGAQQLAWLKQRAALVHCDLESDRERSAHRPGRARRHDRVRSDCQRRCRPSARPRARDRRSPALHAAGADSERHLGDGRRALRGGASLRSAARALQGVRSVLGIRRRPAARDYRRRRRRSTARSDQRSDSTARRADSRHAVGPAAGLQFFGKVRIAAKTRVMTVSLHNLAGDSIYAVELEPER